MWDSCVYIYINLQEGKTNENSYSPFNVLAIRGPDKMKMSLDNC